MQQIIFFVIFLNVFLLGCEKNIGLTVENDPTRPVFHRQEAFKKILNSFEPLGLMHRKEKVFDLKEYQKHAQHLKETQNEPWQYFKENTFYPPSRSKENIMTENNIFLNEIAEYKNAVNLLNDTAQTGDAMAMQGAYDTLHGTCRSCHKQFRK